MSTPRADGFAMPPEWAEHQLTLMAWPCAPSTYWRGGAGAFERVKREQAGVANAVADFEPVLMLVRPEQAAEARAALSARVELLPIELDEAWIRDSGPVFVRDGAGRVALVQFGFNAWGGQASCERDARIPEAIAAHLGVRRYVAPFVLEGGAICVDGAGTLLTTEECLLHPNRNPLLSREQIEDGLREQLGVEAIVWLGRGHHLDHATDGHVDDIAHFAAPGCVLLHAPSHALHPDHASGRENLARLRAARDAHGRPLAVTAFDTGTTRGIPYLNAYLCNGAVIAPVAGVEEDEVALALLRAAHAGREVVPVPARAIFAGGGGPHCVTQQVPAGAFAASGDRRMAAFGQVRSARLSRDRTIDKEQDGDEES